MGRWNGWGDESISYPLTENAHEILIEKIGEATPLPDATLQHVLKQVPQSRLPDHPLITKSEEERVRHARGQSLLDWLALRSGNLGIMPDGVAYPTTGTEGCPRRLAFILIAVHANLFRHLLVMCGCQAVQEQKGVHLYA
jgi:alkyldihydroxyacetonephosphate synthase